MNLTNQTVPPDSESSGNRRQLSWSRIRTYIQDRLKQAQADILNYTWALVCLELSIFTLLSIPTEDKLYFYPLSYFFFHSAFALIILQGMRYRPNWNLKAVRFSNRIRSSGSALFLLSVASVYSLRIIIIMMQKGMPRIDLGYFLLLPTLYIYYLLWVAIPREQITSAAVILYLLFLTPPYQVGLMSMVSPVVLILGWMFIEHLIRRWQAGLELWELPKQSIYIWGFLVIILLSSFRSFYFHNSLNAFQIIACDMLFAVLVMHLNLKVTQRFTIIIGALSMMTLLSGYSVYNLALRIQTFGVLDGFFHRSWTLNCQPDSIAFIVIVLFPLILALLDSYLLTIWRFILIPIAVILLIALLATHEYLAWIIILLEIAAYRILSLWMLLRSVRDPAHTLRGTLIGVGFLFAVPSLIAQSRICLAIQQSLQSWQEISSDLLATVTTHFWLGTGLNVKSYIYPALSVERFRASSPSFTFDPINTWVELLTSSGWLGVSSFLMIVVVAGKNLAVVLREDRKNTPIIIGLITAYFGTLADSLGNFRLLTKENSYLFWVIVVAGLWSKKLADDSPGQIGLNQNRRQRLVVNLGMTVVFAALIGLTTAHGISRYFYQLLLNSTANIIQGTDQQGTNQIFKNLEKVIFYNRFMPHVMYYRGLLAELQARKANDYHERQNYYQDALEAYQKAVDLNPYNEFYLFTKANTLAQKGRFCEAFFTLDHMLRLNSINHRRAAHLSLAELFQRNNDFANVYRQVLAALTIDPNLAQTFTSELGAAIDRNDMRLILYRAITKLSREQTGSPEQKQILAIKYCQAAFAMKAKDLAFRSLACIRQDEHNTPQYYLWFSRIAAEEKFGHSRSILLKSLKDNPGNPLLENELGIINFLYRDLDGARQNFENAVKHWDSIILDNVLAYSMLLTIHEVTRADAQIAIAAPKLRLSLTTLPYQIGEAQSVYSGDHEKLEQLLYYYSYLNRDLQNRLSQSFRISSTKALR